MGGDQSLPSGDYFTEITTSFTVPPAPTQQSEGVTNLWAGLEDGQNRVLQPVLSYGFQREGWQMENIVVGSSNGNPNNTSCPTGDGVYCDNPKAVSSGDNMFVGVILDQGNLGTSCIPSTGANCNYDIFWLDFTSGAVSVLQDWTSPTPLFAAQGLIFEQTVYTGLGLSPPTNCSDYPLGTFVSATVALYHKVGSNFYTQIPTNLVTGDPASGPPWQNPDGCNGPYVASTNGPNLGLFFF
jgi:hypothetical protein